jgi:hypothetical protein
MGAPSDGNQGTLREDVEAFAAEQKANGFKDNKVSRHEMVKWFSATMNAGKGGDKGTRSRRLCRRPDHQH